MPKTHDFVPLCLHILFLSSKKRQKSLIGSWPTKCINDDDDESCGKIHDCLCTLFHLQFFVVNVALYMLIRKVFFYFDTFCTFFFFWDFFPRVLFPYWEVVTEGSAMNKKCDVFWIHLNFWRCCQHTEFSIVFVFTSCLSRNQIIRGGNYHFSSLRISMMCPSIFHKQCQFIY